MFENNFVDLPRPFFTRHAPDEQLNPSLVVVNEALKKQINFTLDNEQLLKLSAGNLAEFELTPLAQKYTGHQFGYYNPELGDGRGLLLGQWVNENETKETDQSINAGQAWDFHLKGAGVTSYSRRGDGRAVLRSVIREYLASEALHGLGVPTTRALSIATSAEQVQREMLEPRASLIRVAQSHIRFGHFEWAANRGIDTFTPLLAHTLQQHYPHLLSLPEAEQAGALLKEVCQRTAKLMAKWQTVGFNHGVMNTDNMSIIGDTFDFGPYAFFDDFKIDYICNHTDTDGRYAYNQQPSIGLWNCKVLAAAFAIVISEQQQAEALEAFVETYNESYLAEMRLKLGLTQTDASDKDLVHDLWVLMDQQAVDFSVFFRRLALLGTEQEDELMALLKDHLSFQGWFARYQARLDAEAVDQQARIDSMLKHNPSIVLRNYIAQEIIDAAELGNYQPLEKWTAILHAPFEAYPELERYQQPPPQTMKGIQLSCSS